jgi:hypothetical protein
MIKPGESIPGSVNVLITVISTEDATYTLVGFLDPGSDQTREVMEYQNYAFKNCSVQLVEIA